MRGSALGVKQGLLLGAALIVYGVLYRSAGLDRIPGLSAVFYLMMPIGVGWGLYSLRGSGPLSYLRGARDGVMIAGWGSLIYAAQVYGYNAFIDDSLLVTTRESVRERLIEQGTDGARLQQAMDRVEALVQPGGFAALIGISLLIVGGASALLLAGLLRRDADGRSAAAGAPASGPSRRRRSGGASAPPLSPPPPPRRP